MPGVDASGSFFVILKIVSKIIDRRALIMGLFSKITDYLTSDGSTPTPPKVGRNEPCHCGSGLKYKRCCFEGDEKIRYDIACKCAGST